MDDRSKKREVTQATDLTEAAKSKATSKATAAVEIAEAVQTDTTTIEKEEREGASAILDSKRKEQPLD
ncbi:MAG: hypothetical protein VW716_09775 [Gammaproteobacteria bacterium]